MKQKLTNKVWKFERTFKSELIISILLMFLISSCLFFYFVVKSTGLDGREPIDSNKIFLEDTTFLSEWYAVFVLIFCGIKITKMLSTKKIYIYDYTEHTFTAWSLIIFLLYSIGIFIGKTLITDKSFVAFYRAGSIHIIVPLIWLTYYFVCPFKDQKSKKQVWLGTLQTVVILSAYLLWIGIRLIPSVAEPDFAFPYPFLSPQKVGLTIYIIANFLIIIAFSLVYVGMYYLNSLNFKRFANYSDNKTMRKYY
ncbi:hypothetical protein [Mycoplasma putrefaciens]|uniref:Transmembrane protein n=1 Tax=Mycoplasma putrefaciens Mput9231 TaxID=1292033 RepID=M9WI52_9MOLU|nr:hypothetical protein [Mycoplasma putrefaciens]AGJ91044.1 Hypothetical protein, predicted transmembrane protein [Mycoplasma putrefaciens Mput9231]